MRNNKAQMNEEPVQAKMKKCGRKNLILLPPFPNNWKIKIRHRVSINLPSQVYRPGVSAEHAPSHRTASVSWKPC